MLVLLIKKGRPFLRPALEKNSANPLYKLFLYDRFGYDSCVAHNTHKVHARSIGGSIQLNRIVTHLNCLQQLSIHIINLNTFNSQF